MVMSLNGLLFLFDFCPSAAHLIGAPFPYRGGVYRFDGVKEAKIEGRMDYAGLQGLEQFLSRSPAQGGIPHSNAGYYSIILASYCDLNSEAGVTKGGVR